eukprot:TRINITY_DN2138_c0_g3_i1.p1 TRINITY_DN2138_c0_g3~~TRINITY_DN2138_c0_g3_i1.p1  ORF type:complete len:475 (-),score=61.98 TRINITY_DN2138_c0_g3_i1:34-1404(-)
MAGRPPWYDSKGSIKTPLLIGVCGGSASGKTSVCSEIIKKLEIPWVVLLCLDSFYKNLTDDQRKNATSYNFDHPDAFDYDLLLSTIKHLKEGKCTEIPQYDFKTHSRSPYSKTIYGADVIILEGILVFFSKELRDEMDIKIFVDTEPDIRLARRLHRDINERGRNIESIFQQYFKFVKPAFEDYILPTKKCADIVIPRGAENTVAINLICTLIKDRLKQRGWDMDGQSTQNTDLLPSGVHVLETNYQIESIITTLRDNTSSRTDLVFYSNRLSRLLIEEALNFLPTEPHTITTPTGAQYTGERVTCKIAAASIMRAGDVMLDALKDVCKDCPIIKILIQSNEKKEPQLFYYKMPKSKNLSGTYILLLDPLLGTGASLIMAIRLLLDHNIPQGNIIFVTFAASFVGIHHVKYLYPRVRIVTCAVEKELNDKGFLVPGLGNFGDRYFGTSLVLSLIHI